MNSSCFSPCAQERPLYAMTKNNENMTADTSAMDLISLRVYFEALKGETLVQFIAERQKQAPGDIEKIVRTLLR